MGEPAIDWDAWTDQATRWLSDYIGVDTVNPPGNETRACDWLGAILDAEGIPYDLYTPGGDESRKTLVARLPGDGSRGKPVILLNHTDVVPFERSYWTVEPLGGEVHDGYIWGRGAQDMKGMGVMELVTFL
ncbi:MAG: M20/M25/M40 family metallo-hydrolase, partial [Dehalococcoidia bacterium]